MTGHARVGDVLRLERRAVVVDPSRTYEEIGIRSFGRGIFHKEPVPGTDLGRKRVFRIEPGDLVISNVFAWEGAIAVASETEAEKIGSHRFMTFVPVDDRIDTAWAAWYFRSEHGLEQIGMASPGSAGRNRTLAIARFEALEIPLPPVNEQRRVAEHFDRIATGAERLRLQSEYASTLSDALAVSIASRPDLSDAAKEASGWRRVRLGSAMRPANARLKVDASRAYPNVGVYSFGRGLFEKPEIDGASTSATTLYRIRAGQFVYSRLFAFEGAYAYVPPEFDGFYVSNEFPAFETDPSQLDARWLAAYVRSPERWAELGGRSKGLGVRRQRVPVEAVMDYEVWLPPVETQQEIIVTLDRLETTQSDRRTLNEKFHALLPAALNEAFASLS